VPDSERQQYLKTIAQLTATVAGLTETINGLRIDLKTQASDQGQRIDALLQQLHGKKSERRPHNPSKMESPKKLLGSISPANDAKVRREANRELIAANSVDGGAEEHRL